MTGPFALPALRPLLAEPAGTVRQSPWWRHAPFARWVLLTLRPHRVAGEGEAFAAMQDLALQAGSMTEWTGDAEGPVELVVLDGSWDEAAAGALCARWEGALAQGAALLVHGIHPGQGGSLAWGRWRADRPDAPHFVLSGGAGLGLLLPDPARAPALQALCDLPPEEAADFASLCAALGAGWTARAEDAAAAAKIAELTRCLEGGRRWSERLERGRAALDAELAAFREREAALSRTVEQQTEQAAEQATKQAAEQAERAADAQRRGRDIELLQRDVEQLRQELEARAARAQAAEAAYAGVTASTAWRLARRIIAVAHRVPPGLRAFMRRAGRLLWWLARGRLLAGLRLHRRRQRLAALLRASPFFDSAWYRRTYHDAAASPLDPALHFAAFGAAENRRGGPVFDALWYLERNPDVAAARLNPLLHYVERGVHESRQWREIPAPEPAERPAPPVEARDRPEFRRPEPHRPASQRPQSRPTEPERPEFERPEMRPDKPPELAQPPLGRDLPRVTLLPVTVGFAVRTVAIDALRRAMDSAGAALDGLGQGRSGSLLAADDGAPADLAQLTSWQVSCLPFRGRPGWAAAHNRLMEAAFSAGAEVYVAAHPEGRFAPDAIVALLRMVRANGRRALVEAMRTPTLPRPMGDGAISWSLPWSSGACLAIPHRVYEAVGGFDPELAAWGADVDYSWRAKAAGFRLFACPDAEFELPFQAEADPVPRGYAASAVLLARKWRLPGAEPYFRSLVDQSVEDLPDLTVAELPERTLAAADFGSGPFLRERPW